MNGNTTITVTLLISVVSLALSGLKILFDIIKSGKKDVHDGAQEARSNATEMTTVVVKMEMLQSSFGDFKNDMQQSMKELKTDLQNNMVELRKDIAAIKEDVNKHGERLAVAEENINILHRRIDQMEIRNHEKHD